MGYSTQAWLYGAWAFAGVTPPPVLFHDKRFLIINKPAGLPVHPGRAGGPSVEDFFPGWRTGKNGPWLAHRLDQDTAGCLLIALKKSSLLAAQDLFGQGEVEKKYWAVVHGIPTAKQGLIDLPLGKTTAGKHWKIVVDQSAAAAVTAWELKGRGDGIAWIEFMPKTGRTHQIRAHSAAIGHPIIGDNIYGGGGKLCLLARTIRLKLTPLVMAQASVPAHMQTMLKECGYDAG